MTFPLATTSASSTASFPYGRSLATALARTRTIAISLLLCAILGALGTLTNPLQAFATTTTSESGQSVTVEDEKQRQLLDQAFQQIHRNYFAEISDEKLVEGAIRGMLSSLDPYSTYLSPQEYSAMKRSTGGEFSGIGVDVMPPDNYGMVRIISPYEGGPAYRAGIKAGDVIIEIDGIEVSEIDKASIVDKLRGNPGTTVKVKVLRDGNQILEFSLMREIIKISPIQKIRLLPHSDIIYLRISIFNNLTAKMIRRDFATFMRKIRQAASPSIPQGLILDLRWNPGGLLDQAVEVAELFLPKGKDIVAIHTGSNEGTQNIQKYTSSAESDLIAGLPMVVLINDGTASAAEIVAGAMQDNGRALLVGVTTFGKASVQTIAPMHNGGAIKLSTAIYYTPSGKMIHRTGINPDIYIDSAGRIGDPAQPLLHKGDSNSSDSTAPLADNKNSPNEDYQLFKALDVMQTMLFYQKQLTQQQEQQHKNSQPRKQQPVTAGNSGDQQKPQLTSPSKSS